MAQSWRTPSAGPTRDRGARQDASTANAPSKPLIEISTTTMNVMDPPITGSDSPALSLARPAQRITAYLIDLACVGLLGTAALLAVTWATNSLIWVTMPGMMSVYLSVTLAYHWVLEQRSPLKRTLGMMLLRIRVTDTYGETPSRRQWAWRCVWRLTGPLTLGLAYLPGTFTGRAVHDRVAQTVVVRAARPSIASADQARTGVGRYLMTIEDYAAACGAVLLVAFVTTTVLRVVMNAPAAGG